MFVSQGLLLAGIGVAIGLAGAFATMRLMSSLLFAVSPVDLPTCAIVSALLMMATILATYVPAARATAVDPLEALDHDSELSYEDVSCEDHR
jgi:ABC-type antimicrobial peptide transport system permease subunit